MGFTAQMILAFSGQTRRLASLSRLPAGRRIIGAFYLLALLGVSAGSLLAQISPPKATRVSLGKVSSPPKGQVMVPLYLTPASEDLRVGSISAVIGFDSKMASFVRAENGFLLEAAEGSFRTNVDKGPEGSTRSVLLLEISTHGEPRKSLKEGLVLTLMFNVAPDAPPGNKVSLALEKVSAADLSTPPKSIEPLSTQNGIIEILSPDALPYVACYFFSH